MAALFISHSSEDNEEVAYVTGRLRDAGYRSLFLDFDPMAGIPAGRRWEPEIYSKVRQSDGVLFFSSPTSLRSPWCFAELALARSIDLPVFQLVIHGGVRHPLLEDTQAIDLEGDLERGIQRLLHDLRSNRFDPNETEWDPDRPPYPGLEAFTTADAGVFFGRQEEVAVIAESLHDPLRRGRGQFIVVVGPSGSGKSSVVNAGVVPRLERQTHPRRWIVVPPLVPGNSPTVNLSGPLATALARRGVHRDRDVLVHALTRGSAGLLDLVRQLLAAGTPEPQLPGSTSVLIVIDQGEELVRVTAPHETSQFLAMVTEAISPESPLSAIVTLRSEFLDAFLETVSTAGGQRPHVIPIAPLPHERLFEMVKGPARRAGLTFEEGLVQRLVSETVGGDAVPLLAYTLRQLYDRTGRDGRITEVMYAKTGGVIGALQHQADLICGLLASEGLGDRVLPTLMKLVSVDSDGEPTRRRVDRRTLDSEEERILQAFVDARLLVSHTLDSGETSVEVVHEALLRKWPPLKDAIQNDAEALRTRTRLERSALDWDAVGRRDSYLLTGDRLLEARTWIAQHPAEADDLPLVDQFVSVSAEADEGAMRRHADLMADRVIDGIPGDPELGLVLAMTLSEEFPRTPKLAYALNRALTATPLRSVLRGHEGPLTVARYAPDRSCIVTASEDGTARVWDAVSLRCLSVCGSHERACVAADLNVDASLVLTAGDDATVRVWDAATGTPRSAPLVHPDEVADAAWYPDGQHVASVSRSGTIRIWDTHTARAVVAAQLDIGPLTAVAVILQGAVLAVGSASGDICILGGDDLVAIAHDRPHEGAVFRIRPVGSNRFLSVSTHRARVAYADDGAEIRSVTNERRAFTAATFSSGEHWCLIAYSDGEMTLEEIDGRDELLSLVGHDDLVVDADWEPGGACVVTASRDGTARVWTRRQEAMEFWENERRGVSSLAWSPDGTRLATASWDETVRFWDPSSGALDRMLLGHPAPVLNVTWSPDGHRLATTCADGLLRVWPCDGDQPEQVHEDAAAFLRGRFSLDGGRLAVGTDDGRAVLFNTRTYELEQEVAGNAGAVQQVAFAPDGDLLATADEERARIWRLSEGGEYVSLDGHTGAVVDVAFSPDAYAVATASTDGTARTWARDGQQIRRYDFDGIVQRVDWAMHGQQLVSLSNRDSVELHSLEDLSSTKTTWEPRDLTDMALAPDTTTLAIGHDSGVVRLRTVEAGEDFLQFDAHVGSVTLGAWALDGRTLATATDDAVATLWRFPSGQTVALLRGHEAPLTDIDFSPQGDVLTAARDGTVRAWSAAGAQTALFGAGSGTYTRARWSPDGGALAAANELSEVLVWDRSSAAPACRLHVPGVRELWWLPEGEVMATLAADGNVTMWDVGTGKPSGELSCGEITAFALFDGGHGVAVTTVGGELRLRDIRTGENRAAPISVQGAACIGCSPDGSRIGVALSGNGVVLVLDAESGEVVNELVGHRSEATMIRWSPVGPLIATVSLDGSLRVWEDLSVDDLLDRAHQCSARIMTEEERLRFALPPLRS